MPGSRLSRPLFHPTAVLQTIASWRSRSACLRGFDRQVPPEELECSIPGIDGGVVLRSLGIELRECHEGVSNARVDRDVRLDSALLQPLGEHLNVLDARAIVLVAPEAQDRPPQPIEYC